MAHTHVLDTLAVKTQPLVQPPIRRRHVDIVPADPPVRQLPLTGIHAEHAPQEVLALSGYTPIATTITAARASEAALGIEAPPHAAAARKLAALTELLCMHTALLPGALSGPDGLPILRDNTLPDTGTAVHTFAQDVLRHLNATALRQMWIVCGGVQLQSFDGALCALAPRATALAGTAVTLLNEWDAAFDAGQTPAPPSDCNAMIALCAEDGAWALDGDCLRIIGTTGAICECSVDIGQLDDVIGSIPARQMATMYYRPLGSQLGRFAAGPLARLNVATHIRTPLANTALSTTRARYAGGVHRKVLPAALIQHARLIEVIAALEQIAVLASEARTTCPMRTLVPDAGGTIGIGMFESPFGTLIHRYETGDDGVITNADLFSAG
jgi:NAD-reducing hydrogenase large subunit